MEINKKKMKSEQSQKKIIEATVRLLAENGYGRTSISDISDATGLTKGALYHHFSNKDELFKVTLSFISDRFVRKLTEIDSTDGSAVSQINHLFDAFISLFEENHNYILIACSLVLELEDETASFTRPLCDMFTRVSTFIEKIVGKGQSNREINPDFDSKLLSLNIIGVLFGNTIPWTMNKERTNYRVIMESQKEILLKSIKN
jgi:AcrR family transcriptional regulator